MAADNLVPTAHSSFFVPYGDSYCVSKPQGYALLVICKDCYSGQEGVGWKGGAITEVAMHLVCI